MVSVNNRAKNTAETLNLGPPKILEANAQKWGPRQVHRVFQVGAIGLVCAQSFESSGELPLGEIPHKFQARGSQPLSSIPLV